MLEVVSYVKLFSVQQGGREEGSCISPKTELIRKRDSTVYSAALRPFAFVSKQLKVSSLKLARVQS